MSDPWALAIAREIIDTMNNTPLGDPSGRSQDDRQLDFLVPLIEDLLRRQHD